MAPVALSLVVTLRVLCILCHFNLRWHPGRMGPRADLQAGALAEERPFARSTAAARLPLSLGPLPPLASQSSLHLPWGSPPLPGPPCSFIHSLGSPIPMLCFGSGFQELPGVCCKCLSTAQALACPDPGSGPMPGLG